MASISIRFSSRINRKDSNQATDNNNKTTASQGMGSQSGSQAMGSSIRTQQTQSI